MLSWLFTKYAKIYHRGLSKFRGSTRLYGILKKLANRDFEEVTEDPEPIAEKEWDNLIILDACRYDLYKEFTEKNVDYRITCGSDSARFVKHNFSEYDFSDTVLVTANPHYNNSGKIQRDVFPDLTNREIENVFHETYHLYEKYWDMESGTVRPEVMVEKSLPLVKLYPEKKFIFHFMQPHYPFLDSSLESNGINPELESEGLGAWKLAEKGLYQDKDLWQAYKRNLEIVLTELENLIENLDGKTVITSDHGNLVGENGMYGHPQEINCEELRKVPWDVVKE